MADERPGGYASPPCFAHELDAGYAGDIETLSDPREVARWRRAERARLIAARLAVPAAGRAAAAEAVARGLDRLVELAPGTVVSAYWPFRGELDLRGWLGAVIARGGRAALPLVVAKGRALVFREWAPGARMERGVWNIPVPAEGPEVVPDVVVAPLVGYDPGCYRLGYGGGFYDRTLAAMARPRLIVGVGLPLAALRTIHPQPHDIAMDVIVTGEAEGEAHMRWRGGSPGTTPSP
ncbi:MAG TPA: 5-formyltetrahydrofolate cyclo-ligase [Thermohalobaculum sp.]|nr:5-formyltetrahydrofolate cyclo-ligase [Thermohalobaculum sp.]